MSDDFEALFQKYAAEESRHEADRQQAREATKKWEAAESLLSHLENAPLNALACQLGRAPTQAEGHAYYAELLIRYCRAIRDAGRSDRPPDLQPRSDGARLALEVLRLVLEDDQLGIVRILDGAAKAPTTLGSDLVTSLLDLLHRLLGTPAPIAGGWVDADASQIESTGTELIEQREPAERAMEMSIGDVEMAEGNEPEGSDGARGDQTQRQAARRELERIATAEVRDIRELSQWCRDAMNCLKSHVRLDGGKWTAWSTPAQRLAREALEHAVQLEADADTIGYLSGQLPADCSVMSAATGLAMIQRLAEWCSDAVAASVMDEAQLNIADNLSAIVNNMDFYWGLANDDSNYKNVPADQRQELAGEAYKILTERIDRLAGADTGEWVGLDIWEFLTHFTGLLRRRATENAPWATTWGRICRDIRQSSPAPDFEHFRREIQGNLERLVGGESVFPPPATLSRRAEQPETTSHDTDSAEAEQAAQAGADADQPEAVGVDGEEVASELQAATTHSPEGDTWVFAPSGDGYYIAVPEGQGYFSGLKGFGQILELIRSPEGTVPMLLLVGGTDGARLGIDRRSRQPTFGPEGFEEIREKRRELKAGLEKAKKDNNPSEADRLQDELDEFNATVTASMGLGKNPRDLNDDRVRLRASIHASLKRAYKALGNGKPPLKGLADHFELSISSQGGCFVYPPAARPPWRFEPPRKM
jgi:hypothetical protein